MEACEHRGQEIGSDRRGGRNTQAPQLQPSDLPQLAFGKSLHAKEFTGASVKDPSGVGQFGRSAAAVDQSNVEAALELTERFGDGRLAEAELGGRLGKAAVV